MSRDEVVPERLGRGGECLYCLFHYLYSGSSVLPHLLLDEIGTYSVYFIAERTRSNDQAVSQLPAFFRRRIRHAIDFSVKTCSQIALPATISRK